MSDRMEKISIFLMFAVIFLHWILFSAWIIYPDTPGKFNAIHIVEGLVASSLVTYISKELVFPLSRKAPIKFLRVIPYIVWELWQIVIANFDVAYRVLHPKMPMSPRIIEFETPLRSELSLTFMANSITLTPGTITIEVVPENGKFVVHAIDKNCADALLVDQTMQNKLAYVFMEGEHDSSI